jgi:purine-binding chemotaxis protein CheW
MSRVQIAESEQQLVVFDVGKEAFGVDISAVQEIIRMQPITQVPGSPASVRGIINLRGRIIPVVDLHERFSLSPSQATKSCRIVVVEIGPYTIGMVVDGVSEVLRVKAESIEPPTGLIAGTEADYVRGIVKLDERLVVLLHLQKLLASDRASLSGGEAS